MAKTKTKKSAKARSSAPLSPWAPVNLAAAMRAARKSGDRISALKRSGILTRVGQLAPRYKSWGKKITHTPKAIELSAQS